MQQAAYWITISHLKRWTNGQINELIKQIYHDNGSDLQDFFSLDQKDGRIAIPLTRREYHLYLKLKIR
jgi:hypothetical protein